MGKEGEGCLRGRVVPTAREPSHKFGLSQIHDAGVVVRVKGCLRAVPAFELAILRAIHHSTPHA
jgi:hypothetical protein